MHLEDLKPAWQQLKCYHSMQELDAGEILALIEDDSNHISWRGVITSLIVFVLLTICCQAG